MIHCLTGKVLKKTPDEVVLSCSGVGFRVLVPTDVYAAIADVGGEATLFTHLNVKEELLELYGFVDERSLDCFKMLITVSGVGPRSALAILSLLSPDRVALAVAGGDFKAFTACAGIGPKLAQRLVLELKDKVKAFGAPGVQDIARSDGAPNGADEAVAALVSLGFSGSEAASAVARLEPGLPVEKAVASALRLLARR